MAELVDQLKAHVGGDEHSLLEEGPGGKLQVRQGAGGPIPTEKELEQGYIAPGRSAMLPWGIIYQAPWKLAADGMGIHAREQIKALAMTGLPLRIQSFGHPVILNEELEPEVQEVAYLEGVSFENTAIAIKQFIFSTPDHLRETLCPSGVRRDLIKQVPRILASTIVYTSWERDRIHPQFVELLKDVGQVWVPCLQNWKAFIDSGVPEKKLQIIPYPYTPSEHTFAAPRGSTKVPEGKRFYHIGKWEPRKNQHRLIGAFLMAFTPKDRASILIKTSGFGIGWANYPSAPESIGFWLKHKKVQENGWTASSVDRLIRIISDRIPKEDIRELHKKNNIYVSSGLGEAWDIPAFEARLAGNRLVYVGFGARIDYADPEEDVLVGMYGAMEKVHPGYHWEPDAQWAEVTADQLAEALRVAEPPKERITPDYFCREFSQFAVGMKMREAILDLAIDLGCDDELFHYSGGFG